MSKSMNVRKERKKFIKESQDYLTIFERLSHRILTIMYLSIFWLIVPFVILIFIVDGFSFPVLIVSGMIVMIFVPIMRQNEKRLETLIKTRKESGMKPSADKKTNLEPTIDSNQEVEFEADYVFPSMYLNVGVNNFYLTLCSMFITALFVWSHGWGDPITTFFLCLSVALLIYSFWFPYSRFVKKDVQVNAEFLKIGKRTLHYREIREIESYRHGDQIYFYLTYTNEPIIISPENEVKQEADDYLKTWCKQLEIPYIEKKKRFVENAKDADNHQ